MKKIIKVALLTLCLVMSCFNSVDRVRAISGSTSMWASASSVTVGDTVSVTVYVSAEGPAIAQLQLYYNSGYLQYSGSSSSDYNPGNGYMVIDTYPNSSASITVTFRTIGVGTTTVSASVLGFIDYDDGYNITGYSSSLSTSITINQTGGGGGGGGGGYTPVTPTKSIDASLSSITVSGFDIEPGFSSDVYNYKIYVPRGTESISISADKSSSTASVSSIDGSLVPGWNEININVTAEDTDYTSTYTLNVYVDEEPTVFYTLNDQQLGVVKNLDKVEVYPEHEARDLEIEGNKITVFKWKAYDVIYLEDSEQNRDFYLYSEHDNTVIGKYRPVEIVGRKFVQPDVLYENFPDLEELFEPAKVRISDDIEMDGWQYKDPQLYDFKLIYLGDENGEMKLYTIDLTEQTLQRYVVPEVEEVIDYKPYIFFSAAVAGAVTLLLAFIAIGRKKTN